MTPQRTESFVPLTAANISPERREFPVTVLHGDGAPARQFQPLAAPPVARPQPSAKSPMASSPCEPRVTVQRDGKRITHLHITCTCGETIDLACLYDEAQGA